MTAKRPTTVLITGATGKQGGAVADALAGEGYAIRALTRDPSSERARRLGQKGWEVVRGDFDDPDSIRVAAEDVDVVFAMTTPFESGAEAEIEQGRVLVDAARGSGAFLVFTSVANADRGTGIPHFESKYAVERYLAESGVPHTIIAPVYFMENLLFPATIEGLKSGVYASPLAGDRPLQQIAIADVGRFGAYVIRHRDRFEGKRIDIASDELDGNTMTRHLAEALDKPVVYSKIPLDAIRQMSEDMALMYQWFIDVGYSADVGGLRERYPEVGWHRFRDWVKTVKLPV